MTIQDLATEALRFYNLKKRNNGEEFWTAPDAPEWIDNMNQEAHGRMLPDNWRFEFIVDALQVLAEHDEDEARETLEQTPEHRYHKLGEWLASSGTRFGYVDEAVQEYGSEGDTATRIQLGMLAEQLEVLSSVLQSLEAELEEREDSED